MAFPVQIPTIGGSTAAQKSVPSPSGSDLPLSSFAVKPEPQQTAKPRSTHRPISQWAPRSRVAAAYRAKLCDRVPKHVEHCYTRGARVWWIYTWKLGSPEQVSRVPYMCNSWRCPSCRKHEAHVTYARAQEACEPLSKEGYLLAVLTLDRQQFERHGVPWQDVDEAYKALGVITRRWFKRLRRWMKRMGMAPIGKEWIATVEAHRSGWPHMNVMMWSPDLAAYVRRHQQECDKFAKCGGCHRAGCNECRNGQLFWGELLQHLAPEPDRYTPKDPANPTPEERCARLGWGPQSTIEVARAGSDRLASYIVKLAGMADRASGELAKLTQLPTVAPIRFRRLRSGKGFLPPRRKDPRFTGTLVRRAAQSDGSTLVQPLHAEGLNLGFDGMRGRQPSVMALGRRTRDRIRRQRQVERICYAEEKLAHEESETLHRTRQRLIRPPVVRFHKFVVQREEPKKGADDG